MNLVIDANIVVACLISPGNKTSELFFSEGLHLLAPEYLKREIEKHKEVIAKKSGLSTADFNLALSLFSSRIVFIPFSDFGKYIPQATEVCPDPNDIEYFAIALKQSCPLWSNDKRLKGQDEIKVLSTSELLKLV